MSTYSVSVPLCRCGNGGTDLHNGSSYLANAPQLEPGSERQQSGLDPALSLIPPAAPSLLCQPSSGASTKYELPKEYFFGRV